MAIKRVYHFCNAKYGLENLERKRLKVATIQDLNDPFELLCHQMSDSDLRKKSLQLKQVIAENMGLICFSSSYANPVQWAHYADKHKGICLGFDVDDSDLFKVNYRSTKLQMPSVDDLDDIQLNFWMEKVVSTKYSHWSYEKEHRVFINLAKMDKSAKILFQRIDARIRLRQVIVGCRSGVTRAKVQSALQGFEYPIEIFKVRTAFTKYSMVRNRNEQLWT